MSRITEHDSIDSESSQDMEYIFESGSELEEGGVILSEPDQEYLLLNISFSLPCTFPKPYLTLNEVSSKLDDALPKPYVWEHHIAEDPDEALAI